jgi:hypothetical protein
MKNKVKIDLKEAIAEAKTIKEVALSNAKIALEEQFHPKLQSMLTAKLNEVDNLDDDESLYEMEDQLDEADDISEEELDELLGEMSDPETEEDTLEGELDEEIDLDALLSEVDETEEDETEVEEIETDETEDETEEEDDKEIGDMTQDELKAFIVQVASELMGSGETIEDEMEMSDEVESEEGDLEMEELDEAEQSDEEVSIDEILSELDELGEEDSTEKDALIKEIKTLKLKLNEANVLNSKLLYFSKLLKENNLLADQKDKIVDAFDKTTSVKEAKLVFETLNESLIVSKTKTKRNLNEGFGFASKASGIKKDNIIEVDPAVARMQKLAGL